MKAFILIISVFLNILIIGAGQKGKEMPAAKKLSPPSESPSFSQEIFPIVFRTCAAIECHGRNQAPNFLTHKKIAKFSDRILTRIHASKDPMPPVDSGKKLTAEEKQKLTEWIKVDCPNN